MLLPPLLPPFASIPTPLPPPLPRRSQSRIYVQAYDAYGNTVQRGGDLFLAAFSSYQAQARLVVAPVLSGVVGTGLYVISYTLASAVTSTPIAVSLQVRMGARG